MSRVIGSVLLVVACSTEPAPPSMPPPGPVMPVHPAPGPPPADNTVRPGTVDLDRPLPTAAVGVRADAACSGCDVVVISLCSLRRDHVGAYGATTGLTPAIDRIAAEGVRFDSAYAASNFTLSGLTAELTGRFGSSTGVLGWGKGLATGVPTLPEVLGLYGYRTGAFTIDAASGLRPDYGLDRGFQRMVVISPPRDTPDGRHGVGKVGGGGASAAPAVGWIAAQPTDRPIFALFHSRTAHFPFVISDEGAAEDPTGVLGALWAEGKAGTARAAMPGMAGGNDFWGLVGGGGDDATRLTRQAGAAGVAIWRREYAKAVARMDRDVEALHAALRARGRLDHTVIIVVADHGESLDDNGELLHGGAYFDDAVHVPLVVRVPGVPAGATDALVSHVDLLPTVLDLLGATPPATIDGVSMRPLLTDPAASIRSTTLVEGGATSVGGTDPPGAVISPPWALLHQSFPCSRAGMPEARAGPPVGGGAGALPSPPAGVGGGPGLGPPVLRNCLFDLSADPEQQRDVASANPEVVTALLARWRGYREAVAGRSVARELQLDPAFIELLRRTGYDFSSPPAR
ncbi:MAG: hypothetical protein EXR71_16685 [Myxococcales bacterium]|nr:hypothetical protein [Myxococcales bacterium]